jgi:predicted O-methyltransferase YrrM
MRVRHLITIQFVMVIAFITTMEILQQEFLEIYFLIAISLYFLILFYLILRIEHRVNKQSKVLQDQISNSITKLQINMEKLSLFLAAQTQNLHLKKLGGWALDVDTAQLLTRIVKLTSPLNVLEFGSGTSTVILARCLQEFPDSKLYSVDDSQEYLADTRKFLKINNLSNVELVHSPLQDKWYSKRPLETFPVFDLIFIDGPIENRLNSIDFIEAHAQEKTIFLIDDYGSIETEGLVEALTSNGKRHLQSFNVGKSIAIVGKPSYLNELKTLL